MSASQITVLKARQLKSCEYTSSVVSRLPEGCTAGVLQFNVSIPTKLWKIIVDRQARAVVAAGARRYSSVTLFPVRDIRDLSVSDGALGLLSRHIPVGLHCVQNAVLVNPVLEEEFSSYGLTILYLSVSFDDPDNFNLGIVLEGLTGSGVGRVIFDARCLSTISMRPSALAVSYIINI